MIDILSPLTADPGFAASATVDAGWTALVLAGQRPGIDPVAESFGFESKALVRVCGEAMLSRVVRALLESPGIGRVLVLAQDVERQFDDTQLAWLRGNDRIDARVSGPTISGSVLSAIAREDVGWPVLVTTADNVLLSPAIVSEFIASAGSRDVSVGFVERGRLEQACGPSHRTWLRFRDGEFTGANLFALRSAKVHNLLRFWEMVEKDRKSLWKLAVRFGPVLLTKVLMRRLSLKSALAAAGERLGVTVQPLLLSDGRIGIDVDKPVDHALVERLLANDGRVGPNPCLTSSDSPRPAA